MGGSESTARGSLEHVAMFFYFSKYPLHKLFSFFILLAYFLEHVAMFFYFSKYPLHKLFSFFILLAYFFVECDDKTSLWCSFDL